MEAGREVYRRLRANLEGALRPVRSVSAAEVKEQEKEPERKGSTVETSLTLGLTYPAHGQVPCLVDRVTVRRNGRVPQFVAAEPLRAGDLIAWEKPLLFVTNVGGYAACDYCGTDCSDIRQISCHGCSSTVGFCNAECRKRAYNTYHWLECLMSDGGISWFREETRLALRLFCLGLTVYEKDFGRLYQRYKSVASAKSPDDPLSAFAGPGHSLKDRHDALFRLPFDEQMARKLCTELFHQLMEKYCRQLASVLRMMNIECNVTHLRELTKYYHFCEAKDRLIKGDGIYPMMSLFRHSCNANLKLISTADNWQLVFVLRPTAKGEPLCLANTEFLQYQMKFEYALIRKYTHARVRLATGGGAAELNVLKVRKV
ncbi:uncharacterized protein LOC131215474 [Anopheles bellator]|uniref:uncharacterized protein LOC131215474 n=1 Tax=Anopheles bellator TaxID=139047 RepID=UPI0026497E89|nr:uncharacterized protein LOC131215474 [Anopheles bellator]